MECPQYSIWLKTLGCLCTTMDMWCDSIVDHQCLLQHYMSCRHPASDVVENLGADFLYGVHSPGDWLWTRLPVEGFFRNKFLSIYIWSIVITELWQRQVARRWKKISNFCSFCGKTTPYGKIFKSLLQKDSSQHRSSCCVQISWNLADRKSVKLCIAYLTKKHFAWLSISRYCADCAQNLPGPAPKNVLRVLQISSKSVHFRQSYSRMGEHRESVLESESKIRLKPIFKPIDDA